MTVGVGDRSENMMSGRKCASMQSSWLSTSIHPHPHHRDHHHRVSMYTHSAC